MADKKTYRDRAEAELRNVQRYIKREELSEADTAGLRLQQATVLATLDLAEAIRRSAGISNGDGPSDEE